MVSKLVKNKIMKVVNFTDLKLNLKKWMDLISNDVEELIIKRKNTNDLVLISLNEYSSLKDTSYLLSGKNRAILIQSLKEAKESQKLEKPIIEE